MNAICHPALNPQSLALKSGGWERFQKVIHDLGAFLSHFPTMFMDSRGFSFVSLIKPRFLFGFADEVMWLRFTKEISLQALFQAD
jgi:hypothetical protein